MLCNIEESRQCGWRVGDRVDECARNGGNEEVAAKKITSLIFKSKSQLGL